MVSQLFEFCPAQLFDQVLGHSVNGCYVGQVNVGFRGAGQFNFGFFGCFLQALQGHRVFAQVNVFFFFELIGQPVNNHFVEIITAQVGVPVGGFYFKHPVSQLENGDIERAASEVVDSHFHVFVAFVQAVSQCGRGGLIDNPFYLQTRNFTGFFGSLALGVIEVSRYCNNRFRYLSAQVIFRHFLHFLQDHSRDFLGRIQPFTDLDTGRIVVPLYHLIANRLQFAGHFIIPAAHKPLDGHNSISGVGDGLAFGRIPDFAFSVFQESHYGRSGPPSFIIGDNGRLAAFHNRYTGIGCS